jgi:hypothetical protein
MAGLKRVRKCSYCNAPGHQRTHCPSMGWIDACADAELPTHTREGVYALLAEHAESILLHANALDSSPKAKTP